jgi:hypothetical protein
MSSTKKAWIDFDLWVSVELGFAKSIGGDLKLSIDPASTSIADKTDLPSLTIAHVIDPVTVSAKVSDLKIGYQFQPSADITITENVADALLKDKTVRVSITDLVSTDLVFSSDVDVAVTTGNLKIKNLRASGVGGFTSQSNSWLGDANTSGSITFEIEKESTTASTITLSNVGVKLDRTVPVTNKEAYNVLVWGTAIAENYGLVDSANRTWKADFNTAGESVPYINIVSSPNDATSILSQEVRVTIGESYYTVNGVTYAMDAVAYINAANDSAMVPVRFVSRALGIRDEEIIWDGTTKTVTIVAPNKTIQFTAGESKMIVDGVSVNMVTANGRAITAEIKELNGLGRMYLPLRALGESLGISVTWEEATQTVVYNANANANTNASVTNTTATVAQ